MPESGSGFYIDPKRNIITHAVFHAADKKAGMDIFELERVVKSLRDQPGCSPRGYKLKAVLGWRQQLQQLDFTEADDALEA